MHSLKDKFENLCLRVKEGRRLESTGSAPIYYLVFPVEEILEVKRQTKAWTAKLENLGWNVTTLSFVEITNSITRSHQLRTMALLGEKMQLDKVKSAIPKKVVTDVTKTLQDQISQRGKLLEIVKGKLAEATSRQNGLLLLTDLEAIHPFLRINSIEAQIQDMVHCPVVVLYPGKREGKTSLRFLNFYPADPNYRSEHIG
jgi:hypothetical protein